ncbi:MAG: hypothetical protein ACPGQ5_01150, partial [Alphaproteobacteria bacterium]
MTANRWVVLAALFLARSALGFHFQSVASVSPLLVEDLGIDSAVADLLRADGIESLYPPQEDAW